MSCVFVYFYWHKKNNQSNPQNNSVHIKFNPDTQINY